MGLFHVHLYKVAGKVELDIVAKDSQEAQDMAFDLVDSIPWEEPESRYLTLVPNEGQDIKDEEKELFKTKCLNSLIC